MKKVYACLLMASLVGAITTSCSKDDDPKDVKIQGPITLKGDFAAYSHGGGNGWLAGDQIGVFVTSDGLPQNNLLYVPSATVADGSREGLGSVLLNPKETPAGFKAGKHDVYAYCPYVNLKCDFTNVSLPDISIQEHNTAEGKYCPKQGYNFGYAFQTLSAVPVAPLDLGKFRFITTQVSAPLKFVAAAKDKTIKEVKLSADFALCYKNATINLKTGKITGEEVKTITYNVPAAAGKITEEFGEIASSTFYLIIMIPGETNAELTDLKAKTFKFTVTTTDNVVYETSGKFGGFSGMNNLTSGYGATFDPLDVKP